MRDTLTHEKYSLPPAVSTYMWARSLADLIAVLRMYSAMELVKVSSDGACTSHKAKKAIEMLH